MPSFNVSIPHTLDAAEAKSRLERFAESLEMKFRDKVSDLSQSWNDNTLAFHFKTFGIKVNGKIAAEDHKLAVNCEIPMSAMIFKSKIESGIREQLERLVKA